MIKVGFIKLIFEHGSAMVEWCDRYRKTKHYRAIALKHKRTKILMNITIVGAGAMGTLFAGLLAEKNSVTLLVRTEKTRRMLSRDGITMSGIADKIKIPLRAFNVTADPAKIPDGDVVILFVKSYNTVTVMKSLKKHLSRKCRVLTLQNGLGSYEAITKAVGIERAVCGTTSEAALLQKTGVVRHTGRGETVIGSVVGGFAEDIAETFNASGIKSRVEQDIDSAIWSKLVINCAINPVATVAHVQNGDILKYPNLKEVAFAAGCEAAAVASALRIKLSFSGVTEKIEGVCRSTAGNINSMLADVIAGRRTEIDQINGAVVRLAAKTGIDAPVNRALYQLLRAL
jgi:2-dehydropantoate 2-reductase